jgi:hypothetical protein
MPTSPLMRAALVTAALIFGGGIAAAPANPQIQPQILETIAQRHRDPRYGIRRKELMEIFGVGLTKVMQIERDAEVVTYLEGASRMATLDSVCIRQIALLLLAYPLEGEAPKARMPTKRFKPHPRARTPQELRGLEAANQHRHEEAQGRRAAKAVSRVRKPGAVSG